MAVTPNLKLIALAALVAAFSASVTAQEFGIDWNPRSGDAWVDTQLDDVNRYGARYREPFVDEMVRHYGAPRALVNELLVTRRWAPGNVYYACAIAQALGRPCRYVVDEWERHHGKGWGEVAQALGIKPGSAEFHRLKRGFVATYDRWARPIQIDHDLREDFPGRGNGARGVEKGNGNSVQGKAAGYPDNQSTGNLHAAPAKDGAAPAAGDTDDGKGASADNAGGGSKRKSTGGGDSDKSPRKGDNGKPQGKTGKG